MDQYYYGDYLYNYDSQTIHSSPSMWEVLFLTSVGHQSLMWPQMYMNAAD